MKKNWKVKAAPVSPVVKASTRHRSLAKILKLPLPELPASRGEKDLAGEAFSVIYGNYNEVTEDEETQPDRLVNKAIMKWALDAGLQVPKASSITSATAATSKWWQEIINSKPVKKALEKQKQAEEMRDTADEKRQEATELMQQTGGDQGDQDGDTGEQEQDSGEGQGDGGGDSGEQDSELEQQIESLLDEADAYDELSQQIGDVGKQEIETLSGQRLTQGIIQQANEQAEKASKQVASIEKGWGLESGSIDLNDLEYILELMEDSVFLELSDIIGRAEIISSQMIERVKEGYLGVVLEPALTKDVRKISQLERIYLSQNSPTIIRAEKVESLLVGNGLFGWTPVIEGKESGSTIMYADISGSMGRHLAQIEKGIALGICRAIKNGLDPERYYECWDFESEVVSGVTVDDDWKEHFEWARMYTGGGTDISKVLLHACNRIRKAKADREVAGTDVVILSDGWSYINDEAKEAWEKLRDEFGTRLIYLHFGSSGSPYLIEQSNYRLELPFDMTSPDSITKVVETISEQLALVHLDNGNGGD